LRLAAVDDQGVLQPGGEVGVDRAGAEAGRPVALDHPEGQDADVPVALVAQVLDDPVHLVPELGVELVRPRGGGPYADRDGQQGELAKHETPPRRSNAVGPLARERQPNLTPGGTPGDDPRMCPAGLT